MGAPMRIADLARDMIRLSGFSEDDIGIQYTGLRPGEKLYEELLIGEQVTGTDHPKIMRAEEDFLSWDQLELLLRRLEAACIEMDRAVIREVLSEAIGGFVSKESVDPMLDAALSGVSQETRKAKVLPLFKA
jgi:FlaA1/EpsC-like NDP-sugar epimerase